MKAVTLALDRARAQASAAIPTQKMVFDKASHAWETIAAQPAGACQADSGPSWDRLSNCQQPLQRSLRRFR